MHFIVPGLQQPIFSTSAPHSKSSRPKQALKSCKQTTSTSEFSPRTNPLPSLYLSLGIASIDNEVLKSAVAQYRHKWAAKFVVMQKEV